MTSHHPRAPGTALALLACLASTPALAVKAEPPPAPVATSAHHVAPITQVTLYPDSALVERSAPIRAGSTELAVPGLPANFDLQTLQIDADAGIEIGDTTLRERTRIAPLTAEEARLDQAIQQLRARLAAIDIDRKAAELELKYLDSLASPGEAARPIEKLAPNLAALRQGSAQAQRRILDADTEKTRLEPQLQGLIRDLERIQPAVSELRDLVIRLRATRDGQLRIRYQLADAGWRPTYRAALDTDAARVDLERTARIAQRSGEDWNRVSLRLSTGQPRSRVSGDVPAPWNLHLRPERPSDARPVAYAPAAPAPMAMAKATAEPSAPPPLFEVAVTQAEFSTEYAISNPVSLPADGRSLGVSLERQPVPVKLQIQVAPRHEKAAYLMARGELPDGVWPVGDVQLYRNGAYIGTTRWDAARGSQLELPFGRDERVRVTTRSVAAQNASSGFVGQLAERHLADEFTITNLHKQPVDLLVLDGAPVGRDDKIEVVARHTPPASTDNWDGRSGLVAWAQRLGPGASQTFSADYRIRWPKERQIQGLP